MVTASIKSDTYFSFTDSSSIFFLVMIGPQITRGGGSCTACSVDNSTKIELTGMKLNEISNCESVESEAIETARK